MKKSILLFASICFALLLACASKSNDSCVENSAVSDSIPQGAIPFEYGDGMSKYIIFNALLNDSIPVKALWDTGSFGVGVSDSLYQILTDKTGNIQIGEYITSPKNIRDLGSYWSDVMGKNTILVGWQIFDGKTIEISFQKRYMREITDTTALSKLTPIPMDINGQNHFIIPVTIYINGCTAGANVVIDTGSNGGVEIGSSSINFPLDTLSQEKSHWLGNVQIDRIIARADSIKIGTSVFDLSCVSVSSVQGRIGNLFLENFTVIFDLKNYRLYLLPLEKEKINESAKIG